MADSTYTTNRAGASVTWEKTADQPNVFLPGSTPVGTLHCTGCGHIAQSVGRTAAEAHAANCFRA